MTGSVIHHKYIVASFIQDCVNLEATLSTLQYNFQKGLKESKELGCQAMIKQLDQHLIGKNVKNKLPAKSVTHNMMQILLSYLLLP